MRGRNWPIVREGMMQALSLPNTGMAITIDVGEARDIHPKNKQAVGSRLATWALTAVYGKPGPAMGPIPNAHKGNMIVVRFDHADGGLVIRGDKPLGFEIAGADRRFVPAEVKISGDMVIISHPDITNLAAARYAFSNFPPSSLYNGAGLPASPFRTDD